MKKTIKIIQSIIISVMILSLCGCVDLYGRFKPNSDPNEKWISKDTNIYFGWNEEKDCLYGKVPLNGETIDIYVDFNYGAGIYFYRYGDGNLSRDNLLFTGQCTFRKGKIIVKDINPNIFGEEVTKITFIREITDENE